MAREPDPHALHAGDLPRRGAGAPDASAGRRRRLVGRQRLGRHRRYADRLASIGLAPRAVLSAVGNSPASVALLLACLAADVPICWLTPGDDARDFRRSRRFAAEAIVRRRSTWRRPAGRRPWRWIPGCA
jgi:hypothetical protein